MAGRRFYYRNGWICGGTFLMGNEMVHIIGRREECVIRDESI